MAAAGSYIGTFVSGVDAKGRFTLPVDLRHVVRAESDGKNIVYLQHEDGAKYLKGFGEAFTVKQNGWVEDEGREARDRGEAFDRHRVKSQSFGNYAAITFDEAGRFALDPVHAMLLGVDSELVFVGAFDTFFVWTPDAFLQSGFATDYQRMSCDMQLQKLREGARRARRAG